MSVAIMTKVWGLHLPDSEKIVLLALADCANDEGLAWPSMATLSRKCSKSERTCQGVIKSLAAKGLLERDEIPGKGCKYWVKADTPAAAAPRKDRAPAKSAPPQGTTDTPAAAAPKPSRTIIPSEAKASSGKRASKSEYHRLDPDWQPVRELPPATAAKVAQWPPGKLEDELAAMHRWAVNAKDENGKGRKKDWQKAWINWLERAHNDWTARRPANDHGGISRTMSASLEAFGSLDFGEPDAPRRASPAGYIGAG